MPTWEMWVADCGMRVVAALGTASAEIKQQALDTSASTSRLLNSDQRRGGARENSVGSCPIAEHGSLVSRRARSFRGIRSVCGNSATAVRQFGDGWLRDCRKIGTK